MDGTIVVVQFEAEVCLKAARVAARQALTGQRSSHARPCHQEQNVVSCHLAFTDFGPLATFEFERERLNARQPTFDLL